MKKVVIVTGGAQGIGKRIAKYLLETGYAVVIPDIDNEAGEETRTEYGSLGDIQFIRTDVSDEHSVEECVRFSLEKFHRLDALVNNAGIVHAHSGPIEQLSLGSLSENHFFITAGSSSSPITIPAATFVAFLLSGP